MDSKEHLERLFVYNDWANRKVLTAVKASGNAEAAKRLAHILVTEREYYERLHGKDSTGFNFWPDIEPEEMSPYLMENAESYERLLGQFEDEGLGQQVTYYTSEGERVKNSFREILTHVLLHSMSHRGQVIKLLREGGFEPPVIDYIIYCREVLR